MVAAAALLFCARVPDGDKYTAVMHFLADGAVSGDAADEAVRSLGRSGSRSRGVRLIVLVHCSDGDVMVSARPQPDNLFFYILGDKVIF